jgi:hypothetical protein
MTGDDEAKICAICAGDRFFLFSRHGSTKCDLVCTGCGVRTAIEVGHDERDTLVAAP